MKEKQRLALITSIALILLAVVGATFAYFYAASVVSEQSIYLNASNPTGLIYDGTGLLSLEGVIPGSKTSVKTFTVENPSTSTINQIYNLSLHIDTNEFTKSHIENTEVVDAPGQLLMYMGYGNCSVDDTSDNPLTCDNVIDIDLTDGDDSTNSGTNIALIEALIEPNEIQEYYVYLEFSDTGLNQDENKNKSFDAHIELTDSTLIKNETLPYDGLNLNKKYKQIYVSVPYTRVEYLESTNSQWIDTLYIPKGATTRVEFDANYLTNACNYIAGIYDGSTYYGARPNPNSGMRWHNSADEDIEYNDYLNRHIFVYDGYKFYVDGVLQSDLGNQGNVTYNTNLTLFARARTQNNGVVTSVDAYSLSRLYSCKIYDNGTLVRDFIPVLDENNVACLYDKVSGDYFYNKGTGDFTTNLSADEQGNIEYDYGDGSLNKTILGYKDKIYLNGIKTEEQTPSSNYGNYNMVYNYNKNTYNFLKTYYQYTGYKLQNVYSGTNMYDLPFNATNEDQTCLLYFRAGGYTTNFKIGNLAFTYNDQLMSLKDLVDAGVIKPIVLMTASGQSSSYQFSDTLSLYDDMNYITNSYKSYVDLYIIFMLNKGNVISSVRFYSSRDYVPADGIQWSSVPTRLVRLTVAPY